MKFKQFLKQIKEETTSADIATVDTKLGTGGPKNVKGKKCKEHKEVNCEICEEDRWK